MRQRCQAYTEGGADRGDQAWVGVAGDQPHPAQASSDQVPEEPEPARAVLAGGDVQAEDLAVAVRGDPGRDQRVDPDDPAAFADLQHQRVGRDEGERPVEAAGPELLDMSVEVLRHLRDLTLAQPGDAEGLDQLVHPPGRDPEQVAGRHRRGEGPARPACAAPAASRGSRSPAAASAPQRRRPGPGVEVAVPVAVAPIRPIFTHRAVLGATDHVCVG